MTLYSTVVFLVTNMLAMAEFQEMLYNIIDLVNTGIKDTNKLTSTILDYIHT